MIEYSLVSAASAIKRHFKGIYLHFSQNLPVKPSTHWHCCQDQWSKQVPPCLQGLAVQAPSSLGHLQTQRQTNRQSDSQFDKSAAQSAAGGSAEKETPEKGGRWAVISLPVLQYKKPIKNPKRICILKDLSSPHYSAAGQKREKNLRNSAIGFPRQKSAVCIKKHLFKISRRVWECEQMSHSESRGG